ncbi:T9SS type A sorting domain-containing protein [bacterium]|nr:T9SS type A sorting domain-containing protein [bacterium]
MRRLVPVLVMLLVVASLSVAEWGLVDTPFDANTNYIHEFPSGKLLMSTSAGLFASLDGGQSWHFAGVGTLDLSSGSRAVEMEDGRILIAADQALLGNSDCHSFHVLSWYPPNIKQIVRYGDTLYAATMYEIYRSTNGGGQWQRVLSRESNLWESIYRLRINPVDGSVVAHMERPGGIFVWYSEDGGDNWTQQQFTGVFGSLEDMEFDSDGTLWYTHNYQIQQVHALRTTTDFGETSTEIHATDDNFSLGNFSLGSDGSIVIARHPGFLYSSNGTDFDLVNPDDISALEMVHMSGSTIVVGTSEGVYSSNDGGSNWSTTTSGLFGSLMADAAVGSNGEVFILRSGKAFFDTGDGFSTVEAPSYQSHSMYVEAASVGENGEMVVLGGVNQGGTHAGGFYSSDGTSWTAVNGASELEATIDHLVEVDGTFYASTQTSGLLSSTDGGVNWTVLSTDAAGKVAVNGNGDMLMADWTGIRISTDNGSTWNPITIDVTTPETLIGNPTNSTFLLAGGFGGIERTTDGGETSTDIMAAINNTLGAEYWQNGRINIAYDASGTLFAAVEVQINANGLQQTRLLSSGDDGDSFSDITPTLPQVPFRFSSVTKLRAGSDGSMMALTNHGLYLNTLTVAAEEQAASAPIRFELAQNHPNPFNPSTTISFTIPQSGFAKVSVFDLLGRQVATLLDAPVSAGQHQIQFNGASIPSGVYFYRLEAVGMTDTRKMLLVK